MERFKANIFLIIVLWVQFGSTGMTYFENSCSTTGVSWYSASSVSCCCSLKSDIVDDHTKWEEQFSKECCSSIEHFLSTADDYWSSDFELELNDLNIEFISFNQLELQADLVQWSSDNQSLGDSPPQRNVDTRIFIQSFQI